MIPLKKLGVLGGMGPVATVAFVNKIIEGTKNAVCDQDHVAMLVSNVPQIPDRTEAILRGKEDPFQALRQSMKDLEAGGATLFVITCNTAHHWLGQLLAEAKIPNISMIEAVADEAVRRGLGSVGLLATEGTVHAGLYQKSFSNRGIRCVVPNEEMQRKVTEGIYTLKSGNLEESTTLLQQAFDNLLENDVDACVLGCTEVPVALQSTVHATPSKCLDSLQILADACLNWYFGVDVTAGG